MDTKKFTFDNEIEEDVLKKDVLKNGDWVLTWNPKGKESGFEFFTPMNFTPETGAAPMGGVLMAAFYYLVSNDSEDFMQSVIARANAVAREVEAHEKGSAKATFGSSNRTLN